MVLNKNSKLFVFFCLLIILLIAGFFRLWQLDKIPPGLYPDVAINGNDALDTLKAGDFKVFYPENQGREGLFFWLIALSFLTFGDSVWSIKIVAAVIGILTVPGLYLLTKELFFKSVENSSRPIALLSSFFLTISFWHVNFSRIGFRAILIPFILVFAFYFLVRGFREKKILNFIISGIFFGLGFYTYISYRFIVLLLPLILLFWWLIYRKEKQTKKFLLFTFYFLLFTFIVALPIGLYFLQNPQDFFGRAGNVSVLKAAEPLFALGKSLIAHLGMFNFFGDQNWRHNFAGSPTLFWPIGILFLLGIAVGFKEIFKKSNYREKNYQSLFPFYFLFFSFFIMLLPGVLSFEGIPHALRVIGAVPPVFIFAGLGGYQLYNFLNKKLKNKKFLIVFCFLFLTFLTFSEFNKYFSHWAKNPNVKGAFSSDLAEIGNYLNSLPDNVQKYVIVNLSGVPVPLWQGLPMPAQTPMFIERTKYGKSRAVYLLPENLSHIKIEKETPNKPLQDYTEQVVIVPMSAREDLFENLRQMFPEGEKKEEQGIWIYRVNF